MRLLAGCAWLGGTVALADDASSVDVVWDAPAGCPSAAAVRDEIDGLLGGAATVRARASLRVHATVTRAERWTVTIETVSGAGSGHRSIEASSCDGLASASALIVALMIDPDAVAAHAKNTAETKAEVRPAPPPAPAPVVPSPASPRSTLGLVAAGGAAHLGVLPAADAGFELGLGLVRAGWRGELRLAYFPRRVRSEPVADVPGAYGRFGFSAATVDGCRLAKWQRVELGGCALLEAGILAGEGFGASEPSTQLTPWLGLGAGGVLVVEATAWLRFPLHVEGVVPLWRPNFVFRRADHPIFRSAPVGGRLTLAAEARF